MNKLLGTAPRHPGMWVNTPQNSTELPAQPSINTVRSDSRGEQELKNLAPQLATLSQQGRWIVLINPPHISYKQLLANAGVRTDRVLLVHSKDEVETLWAAEKALTSGTSSAVVCWTSSLDKRDSRRLQLVAKSAQAIGLVIEEAEDVSSQELCYSRSTFSAKLNNFAAVH
ncbi:cell division inhibitor SulA [Shewanella intestini]|uniref:Cell division protein n=1 Tax=Shewanella intestini TaxID=2017544 RepID=A0ABS5I225_9GAMM|nr:MULTISPECIES: SulA-like leucine-rich domain-containing protein [Shewanella]MBR9728083.1 cell division protein [Shewanella intestini]MRG36555.1 cell division protein [Shewanella sp. XMDDZSB0408]